MYTECKIITNTPTQELESLLEYIGQNHTQNITILELQEALEERDEQCLYLLYLCDDGIKKFFSHHLDSNITLAILPNSNSQKANKSYTISPNINDAIDDAFNLSLLTQIDILKCNETIVFSSVIIGDMHGMNHHNFSSASLFEKLKIFWNNLQNIQFQNYTLGLMQGREIKSVAAGITILEQSFSKTESKIDELLPVHDGKLNAFILAPTSLIAYLWYLFSMFVTKKISLGALPEGLGYIQTPQLSIRASHPIEFMIDSALACAKDVELIVISDAFNLHLGRALLPNIEEQRENPQETKSSSDTIDIKTLPQDALGEILVSGRLPFFKKASDEEFKELFIGLRSSAKLSSVFITLMVLSTLLATTGLFANSASVVIGAMILAPLMAPIVSLAMGTIRADVSLMKRSAITLSIGISLAIFFSFLFTLIMPIKEITPEMMSRLHPNLLDLMVALFSGMAGAYATSKEEVAKSLAGVAIAVALVPPLSVTGIGFGMMSAEVIYGSFLLFATNLIGITLSAALTFVVLGYAPLHKATKGIIYTSIMALLISLPLLFSFIDLIERNNLLNQIKSLKHKTLNQQEIELHIIELTEEEEKLTLELNLISTEILSKEDLQRVKDTIQKSLKRDVILKINQELIIR